MNQYKQNQENLLIVVTYCDDFLYTDNLKQLSHHCGKGCSYHPIRAEQECRSHFLGPHS